MTQKRTADEIVDAIAEAGHRLFLERSPSAVSVREIATEANVNLGLIHRYVGSKDDVIALVLRRHTARARTAISEIAPDDLLRQVAEVVVRHPATGRLIGGMILDGVDVAELKGEFPLLESLRGDGGEVGAALTYALALGWEVFGPSLLAATGARPEPDELTDAVADAMVAINAAGGAPSPNSRSAATNR